jgi:hypothetical protein
MKRYKKLYQEECQKVCELKERLDSMCKEKEIKEKNVEPYSVDIYFDEKEENIAHIENVIKHETNYKPYPDCRPENWKITTADGLTSVFDYDKVVYILAYRESKR